MISSSIEIHLKIYSNLTPEKGTMSFHIMKIGNERGMLASSTQNSTYRYLCYSHNYYKVENKNNFLSVTAVSRRGREWRTKVTIKKKPQKKE